MTEGCVFCTKIKLGKAETADGFHTYRFEPLNPVTPGHMLFVSEYHTEDAASDPGITGEVFEAASWYADEQEEQFNLITSAGPDATQTILHMHVHYVPRRENDGLHLPWTGQIKNG